VTTLLNLNNNWMKNIVASGFFLVTLFLAEEEKVTGLKGFKSKTIMDDGAKRAFKFPKNRSCCSKKVSPIPPRNLLSYQ
jgi:hypothetical protein